MDSMFIRDLEVRCTIGTRPHERETRQKILINIELACNLAPAGRSDRLRDTVNYSDLRHRIVGMAQGSSFLLLERLAEETARLCLADPRVLKVAVTVDKPAALAEARSAAVRIERAGRGGRSRKR